MAMILVLRNSTILERKFDMNFGDPGRNASVLCRDTTNENFAGAKNEISSARGRWACTIGLLFLIRLPRAQG
jgi:hypothetical protein